MSDKQKKDFKKALEGALDGYEMDQCLDCPPDSGEELCKVKGDIKTGTKIFFVKEERLKSILFIQLPS